MINIRNLGDKFVVMRIKGTLTTTAGNAQSYDFTEPLPFAATIKAIWGYEKTPGTSAAGTAGDCIDLLYGAAGVAPTTLLSSGAMFNFGSSTAGGIIPAGSAVTATLGGYNTANITTTAQNPPLVAKGGILAIAVKTVAATTAGADFVCVVALNRARQGSNIDPVQTGTYDPDSDVL